MYETAGLTPDPVTPDESLEEANVVNQWNNTGYGVVPWWGHGNYTGAYRYYQSGSSSYTMTGFLSYSDTLSNTYPAIVFACSCENGYPEETNNLGATILKNGGIDIVCGTRDTYFSGGWESPSDGGNSTMDYLFTRYLLMDGGQRVGKALRLADVDDHDNYSSGWGPYGLCNWYGFNLYGDPAVKLDDEGAPTVSNVSPDSMENTGTASLTVQGTNYVTGASVKITQSGQSDVAATNVVVDSPAEITCDVNVDNINYGNWNVVVTDPDSNAGTLTNGLAVTNPVPTVTGLTPSTGVNTGTVHISNLAGTNFRSSATVQLQKSGQTPITATSVARVSNTQITCDFDLTGAVNGRWNVFVENGGGKNITLANGFTITNPPPVISSVTPNSMPNNGSESVSVAVSNVTSGVYPSSVKLQKSGRADIDGQTTSWTNLSGGSWSTTCTFDLSNAVGGSWDVVVTDSDGASGTLTDGFTVVNVHPVITKITPTEGFIGDTITIEGSNFGDTQGLVFFDDGGEQVIKYSSWTDTKIVCTVPPDATTGPVMVSESTYHTESDGVNFTVKTTPVNPLSLWYLAEGSSDWGFATYVNILNPNPESVTAKITYMTSKGPITRSNLSLPANSQTTVNPFNDIGKADFSTKVECLGGKTITVDRTMIWTGPGAKSPEAHASVGVNSPNNKWYLAEGSSKWGFETWLLIQNPTAKKAVCQVTYMIEGESPQTFQKVIPANTRQTYNIADDIGAKDASIKVVSQTTPVIVERSMYRNNRREGHESIGTPSPSKQYYLAEGTTDWGFTTYVLVQNPNNSNATINITYNTSGGPVTKPPFVMPPNSRKTIGVNNDLVKKDFSTSIKSDVPIVAERSMYWGAGTPLGEACHDSIGLAAPHKTFYFADGQSSNGWETWTLVQNPNSIDVQIEIDYLLAGGGVKKHLDTVKANSRKSFFMADVVPNGRAGTVVKTLQPALKIMVERSMYFNNRGAGTDTIGGFSD